jgi:integrase/recombinase XerC
MLNLIDAHLDWCRAGGLRERTVDDRQYVLRRMDHELEYGVEESSDIELQAWFARASRPRGHAWKARTLRTFWTHAWEFYDWAAGRYLDINPMVGLRKPQVPAPAPHPISDEHLEAILARAKEPFRIFAVVAALAGLRCCELAGLRREHITSTSLWIPDGKGGKAATLDVCPDLWTALEHYPPGLVAAAAGGVPDARWISTRSSKHYQRDLHLPVGVSLHPIRHWYARECRRLGADSITLQACMRHSRLQTTQHYYEAGEAERRPVMTALRLPVAA